VADLAVQRRAERRRRTRGRRTSRRSAGRAMQLTAGSDCHYKGRFDARSTGEKLWKRVIPKSIALSSRGSPRWLEWRPVRIGALNEAARRCPVDRGDGQGQHLSVQQGTGGVGVSRLMLQEGPFQPLEPLLSADNSQATHRQSRHSISLAGHPALTLR